MSRARLLWCLSRPLGVAALGALIACSPAAPPPPQTPPTRVETPPAGCPAEEPALAEEGDEAEGEPLGLTIKHVCVFGAGGDTLSQIQQALALRVGQPLSLEATRASLEQLTKTNLFEDARVGAEARDGGAMVHVIVRERPRIEEVVYAPEAVRSMGSPLAAGGRADPLALREAAKQMELALHQQGRGSAKVATSLEPTKAGAVRLRVEVDLGPAWVIARTAFPGATQVPEPELQAASAIKPGSPWSADVSAGAALRLTSLYLDRGFVNVKVAEPEQSVDASGGVTLSWKIEEGASYKLGKVTFRGKPADKARGELGRLMKSRSRAVFNRSLFAADIERIRELFAQRGRKVEVTPAVRLDAKRQTVDVDLEINEPGGG